jgi:hypothetical protein
MQVAPTSLTHPAFEPGSASSTALFASTATLPDAAEHTADLSERDHPSPPYFAALAPHRASVITPAVLQVLEWHRQHHQPR